MRKPDGNDDAGEVRQRDAIIVSHFPSRVEECVSEECWCGATSMHGEVTVVVN